MASPIILKPLTLSEQEAVPLVLCLNAPHVWEATWDGVPLGVSLAIENGPPYPYHLSEQHLHMDERRSAVEPLARYGATARDAFLRYAAQKLGNEEVVLP